MFEDSSPSQKRRLNSDAFDTPIRSTSGPVLPGFGTPSSEAPPRRFDCMSPTSIATQLAREVSEMSKAPDAADKREVFVIGIAGGTASGKTTLTNAIMGSLRDHRVRSISMDSFYKSLTEEEIANAHSENHDFDHPNSFDHERLAAALEDIKNGTPTTIPVYCFKTHSRLNEVEHIDPPDVLIIEGILVLFDDHVRSCMNLRVFVDTDSDLRLGRRIERDVASRGRTMQGVLKQYQRFVKPSFDKFVEPCKRYAHLIIPWNEGNPEAVTLIGEHVKTKLKQHDLKAVHRNLHCFSTSHFQIRALHSYIRDRETPRDRFVFFCNRLIRLVIEESLGYLPFTEEVVTTASGNLYTGVNFASHICGISISRSGEAMEPALRECCQSVRVGKVLIQKCPDKGRKGEKRSVWFVRLPKDIKDRHVLLMDPIAHSGRTAARAIKHLKENYQVKEENILFVSLISSRHAVNLLCKSFPKMQVITTAIDEVDSNGQMVPGCPIHFADKYFGTGGDDHLDVEVNGTTGQLGSMSICHSASPTATSESKAASQLS